MLLDQLYSYFENLNLFGGNQFGLLKHSSGLSVALQIVDILKSNVSETYVAYMFIDKKSPFDTVDPNRLACKLKRQGPSDKIQLILC